MLSYCPWNHLQTLNWYWDGMDTYNPAILYLDTTLYLFVINKYIFQEQGNTSKKVHKYLQNDWNLPRLLQQEVKKVTLSKFTNIFLLFLPTDLFYKLDLHLFQITHSKLHNSNTIQFPHHHQNAVSNEHCTYPYPFDTFPQEFFSTKHCA